MNTSHTTQRSDDPADQRLLTEAGAKKIYERVLALQRGKGRVAVKLTAWWQGNLTWARNRTSLSSDRRDIDVWICRQTDRGMDGQVWTNQVDDASLEAAVRAAEYYTESFGTGFVGTIDQQHDGLPIVPPLLPFPETSIWSDSTYNVTPEQRAAIAQLLSTGAEQHGMLSAGFLQMRIAEHWSYGLSTDGWPLAGEEQELGLDVQPVGRGVDRKSRTVGYVRHTESQCSMTVRHPQGVGSGWAGLSSYDWSSLDGEALAKRALDKCLNSLNPVAIEPGRYTVILEPSAVNVLVSPLVGSLQQRDYVERGGGPFALGVDTALGIGRTKLGLKVIDERISLRHDPMHPTLGIPPMLGLGPIHWIKNGILTNISYGRGGAWNDYALPLLSENLPQLPRNSFEMTGGNTTIEEMISTTKRGVIVTRLFGLRQINGAALLYTGVTRDGLWLVENGKISKAIKNMRWTDSPLFVLNQIEQLGHPVPVFRPGDDTLNPAILPPIKSNDFAFTSTIDAI